MCYENSADAFVQFLQSAREEDVKSVYGEHFDRLVRLKATLDPTDFFKHSMFIRLDGVQGPDEWKQLPPLTEERVRELNAATAATASTVAKGKKKAEETPTDQFADALNKPISSSHPLEPERGGTAQNVREMQLDAPGNQMRTAEANVVAPVKSGPE